MWKNIVIAGCVAFVAMTAGAATSPAASSESSTPVWGGPPSGLSSETFQYDTKSPSDAQATAVLRDEVAAKRVGRFAALVNKVESLHLGNVPKIAWLLLIVGAVALALCLFWKFRPARSEQW